MLHFHAPSRINVKQVPQPYLIFFMLANYSPKSMKLATIFAINFNLSATSTNNIFAVMFHRYRITETGKLDI